MRKAIRPGGWVLGIGYRKQGAVCSKRGTTDYRTTDNRTTRRKKDSEQWAASRGISVKC